MEDMFKLEVYCYINKFIIFLYKYILFLLMIKLVIWVLILFFGRVDVDIECQFIELDLNNLWIDDDDDEGFEVFFYVWGDIIEIMLI